MALAIREIHAAPDRERLNYEWLVVENAGETPLHTAGLSVTVGPVHGRPRPVARLDPGFSIAPGGRHRLVSGSPSRKAHGAAPEDGIPNYYLFLKVGYLDRPQSVVRLARNQLELARAVFDPDAADGVGS